MDKFQVPALKLWGNVSFSSWVSCCGRECLRGCQVVHQGKASEDRKDRQNLVAAGRQTSAVRIFGGFLGQRRKTLRDILKNSSLPNHKPVLSMSNFQGASTISNR